MRTLINLLFFLLIPLATAGESKSCQTAIHQIAAPLIGTWHEFSDLNTGEKYEGELKSYFAAGGCAYVQEFSNPDQSFTFRSLGFVDPKLKQWREQFVLSHGRVATYLWQVEGKDILLNRMADSKTKLYRLRLTNIQKDTYEVFEERSTDGGKTWQQGLRTITRRVK